MDRGLKPNAGALGAVRKLMRRSGMGVRASRLLAGTTVVDCGVESAGGYQAGLLFAEACMGGLGRASLIPWQEGGLFLPGVQVVTDQPWAACMAAQYAGWAIKAEKFFAMGSGPARALAGSEKLFSQLPALAPEQVAVLSLEGRRLPPEAVAWQVAGRCGVDPQNLTLLVAPTACAVGSVQVSARVVETALHKLHELGFDVTAVRTGWGTAPLAPVAADDLTAMGRTNDCILYGGRVVLSVDAPDTELARLAEQLPSATSRDYGRPFLEVFRRYDCDFYQIDPHLFSPAEVWLTSVSSGRTFHGGRVNPSILQQSLFGGEMLEGSHPDQPR